MYIFDTGAFYVLGTYYPSRFPTIWKRIDELIVKHELRSTKEVRREIETNFPFDHVVKWVHRNRNIFYKPNPGEMEIVAQIFKHKQFLGLVKKDHIYRGLPVADPFVVAAAKIHKGTVVTQESFKKGGAKIPTVCVEFDVACIDIEEFLEREKLQY